MYMKVGLVIVPVLGAALACANLDQPIDAPDGIDDPNDQAVDVELWNQNLSLDVTVFPAADSLVWAKITMTNTGPETLESFTGGCGWWFRVFDSPGRTGSPLWREEDSSYNVCNNRRFHFSIPPGASHEFEYEHMIGTLEEITGGRSSLTYYFTAELALGPQEQRTRAYTAGEATLPPN